MKPRTPTHRRICLRCDKPFKSTGKGNRICEKCKLVRDGIRIHKCLDHRSHP